jgi:excisionase family DNA binding protein
MGENDIYTVSQVATILDVTENTVREQIRNGKLKAYKKLNRWYVYKKDLDNYIKSE